MASNCWILVHADSGTEWDNGDYEPHFATKEDATEVAQPGWVPRQREQSCLIVVCGCGDCTEVFDKSGEGYTVHCDSVDDAEQVTADAEWTKLADGTYRCVACSPGGDCDCLAALASQQPGEAS